MSHQLFHCALALCCGVEKTCVDSCWQCCRLRLFFFVHTLPEQTDKLTSEPVFPHHCMCQGHVLHAQRSRSDLEKALTTLHANIELHRTPSTQPRSLGPVLEDHGDSLHPSLCQSAKELGRLVGPPASHSAAKTTKVVSTANWALPCRGSPSTTTPVVHWNIQIHVPDEHVGSNPSTNLATDPCGHTLQCVPAATQHPRPRTSCSMMATEVKWKATSAVANRQRGRAWRRRRRRITRNK